MMVQWVEVVMVWERWCGRAKENVDRRISSVRHSVLGVRSISDDHNRENGRDAPLVLKSDSDELREESVEEVASNSMEDAALCARKFLAWQRNVSI